jgi:hypothetical protein
MQNDLAVILENRPVYYSIQKTHHYEKSERKSQTQGQ